MSNYVEELAALFASGHVGSYGNECVTMSGYRIGVGGAGEELRLWVGLPGDEAHWEVKLPTDVAVILYLHLGAALRVREEKANG